MSSKSSLPQTVEYDDFGYSVAINGDTIVIGAWHDQGLSGSAYIYEKPIVPTYLFPLILE